SAQILDWKLIDNRTGGEFIVFFLKLVEISALVLLVTYLITQLAIPGLLGQPLNPLFRRGRQLDKKLGEAEEQVRLAQQERKVTSTLRRAGISRPIRKDEDQDGNDNEARSQQ